MNKSLKITGLIHKGIVSRINRTSRTMDTEMPRFVVFIQVYIFHAPLQVNSSALEIVAYRLVHVAGVQTSTDLIFEYLHRFCFFFNPDSVHLLG